MRKRDQKKIAEVVNAWETLRPEKSFAGFTLTAFKTAMQPTSDTRSQIDSLQSQLIASAKKRDDADAAAMQQLLLVVNAVKGDPEEGDNGELYAAMGYVRRSDRVSGLTRKTATASTPPA